MPLRFVKVPRVNSSQDVLHIAVSTTSLMRELSSMSFFPPATAAVSIVLLILQTVQGVQNNKDACLRLARRCARILLDINDQMAGRWDTAPPTLIRNLERFQRTLTSIYEFVKVLTDATWARRFMKKSSIENSIVEYSAVLEDAAQSFQIATLIDIHYAVSTRSTEREVSRANSPPPPYPLSTESIANRVTTPSRMEPCLKTDEESRRMSNSATLISEPIVVEEPQEEHLDEDHIISDQTLESRGFRRYHQSEVRLKGRSNLKSGWWAGTSAAEVEGRPTLIKRYEGSSENSLKAWVNDVKLLQSVFHPNLPQMIGVSREGAPTPFILLSHVQTRSPQSLLSHTLKTRGLAACARLILQFYQDVVDATVYIQHQRGLDDRQAQDFIDNASFRVDSSNTMIMGLAAEHDEWVTARNYGLTESLKKVVMDMLPNTRTIEYNRDSRPDDRDEHRSLTHLVTVARGLLPADDSSITLPPRVQALSGVRDDEDYDIDEFGPTQHSNFSFRQMRLSNLEATTHNHTWKEGGGIAPFKFSPGDLGYVPQGKDFKDFILLGNVKHNALAKFDIQVYAHGIQWSWKDFPIHHLVMEPAPLPGDATCWTVAVPPNGQIDCQITHSSVITTIADAWRFLLLNGNDLAIKHKIPPEELILITCAGTNQDFYIRDFSAPSHFGLAPPQLHGFKSHPHQSPFMHSHPSRNSPPQLLPVMHQRNLPTIMYLLTSANPAFEPYWSHSPISLPNDARRPDLKSGWTYKIGWCTGFIQYVQLHPEDFTD